MDAGRWLRTGKAAFTANDQDAVAQSYWPDAILLGTVSPIMSVGTDAIRKYFANLPGSGLKNELEEKHSVVVDDNAAMVAGFYMFTRLEAGKPVPIPARFTMLVTRRDGTWNIAHHHSSPRALPK